MKHIVLLLSAIVAFGQQTEQNRTAEDALLLEAQSPSGNYLTFFQVLEQRALQADQEAASRTGGALTLRLRSGSRTTFSDVGGCASFEPQEVARCKIFALVAYVRSLGVFVLYEQHYEGGQYLLVNDQDGRQTVVGAVPNFSRSGNRAIVCLVSVYDGFEVQVWKRDGSGWVKEWAESPFFDFYTEYKFLRWTSEMSADLEAIIVDERNTQSRRIQPLTLTLRNEKWTILPASNSATGRF